MKIILDHPLCIHEIGHRTTQQDTVVPAFGDAHSSDRHFMVGEGPLSDVYLQKASLTFHAKGVTAKYLGKCRIIQIRPGFDDFILDLCDAEVEKSVEIGDVQTGDWFLILTDGMCEFLMVEDLIDIVNRPDWTAEHKRDALLDYSSENEDNHSAYILHVRGVDESEPEVLQTPESVMAVESFEEEKIATEKNVTAENKVEKYIPDPIVKATPKKRSFSLSFTPKSFLIVLLGAYLIALVIGFFRGLFG